MIPSLWDGGRRHFNKRKLVALGFQPALQPCPQPLHDTHATDSPPPTFQHARDMTLPCNAGAMLSIARFSREPARSDSPHAPLRVFASLLFNSVFSAVHLELVQISAD